MTAGQDLPLPRGQEKAEAIRGLFDTIAGRYDLVNRVMTFGMDVGWRRRTVRELRLPGRSVVLDLACGTGDLCRELTRAAYRPLGFDFSHQMLLHANRDTPLVEADILRLPLRSGAADGVTCGFALRNVVSLPDLFTEISRVVRPGGRVALLEASEPDNPVMRAGHSFYFNRAVPVIGGLLSNRAAYSYLPKSMAYLPPAEETSRMLANAGFPVAGRLQLSGGIVQLLVATRA